MLVGKWFFCGDSIISLPNNYIIIAEKISSTFWPEECKNFVSVR